MRQQPQNPLQNKLLKLVERQLPSRTNKGQLVPVEADPQSSPFKLDGDDPGWPVELPVASLSPAEPEPDTGDIDESGEPEEPYGAPTADLAG